MDKIHFSTVIGFNCHKDWKGLHKLPNQFEMSSDINSDSIICKNSQETITLFGKQFQFSAALQTEEEWLFSMCRKEFLELNNLVNDSLQMYEKLNKHIIEDANELALIFRLNVSMFLNYVNSYLNLYTCNIEISSLIVKYLSKLETHLNNLKTLFEELNVYFLSEHVLLLYSSGSSHMFSVPFYHLVHCHLDFRWLYILISKKFEKIKTDAISDNTSSLECFAYNNLNYSEISLLIMCELLLMSAMKFKKFNEFNEDFYTCSCIEKLWINLFHSLGPEVFWNHINQIVLNFLEKKPVSDNKILSFMQNCSSFLHFEAKIEFSFFLLASLSKFLNYVNWKVCYSSNTFRFTLFDDIINIFLDSNPPEKLLRNIMPLIISILNLWEYRNEKVIISIWEYFYKKITTIEFENTNTKNYEHISRSPKQFLKEVKDRFLLKERLETNENIFSHFLRLLGLYFKFCRLNSLPYQNVYDRIYVKFYALDEILDLSEVGLYYMTSLFLTIVVSLDTETEIKHFHNIIISSFSQKISEGKRTILWTTLSVCLMLLGENGFYLEEVAKDMIREIEYSLSLSNGDTFQTSAFIECLKHLIEIRNWQICFLMDKWIEMYLKKSANNTASSFISIFQPLISNLRRNLLQCSQVSGYLHICRALFYHRRVPQCIIFFTVLPAWSKANKFYDVFVEDEISRIKKKLHDYILPATNTYVNIFVVETAAEFISLFLEDGTYSSDLLSLYSHWINTENNDVLFCFITSIYKENQNVLQLKTIFPNYHKDIVECFIRSYFLSNKNPDKFRYETLNIIVSSLTNIAYYSNITNYEWSKEKDGLASFLHLFGLAYQKIQKTDVKSSLTELFNSYFCKLEEWIDKGIMEIENCNNSLAYNIYRYSGLIVLKCHSMIYENSSPCSLLKKIIDKLLLPFKIFKRDYKIPFSIADAVIKSLPLFIGGLFKMDPKNDFYLSKILREIICYYLPKLVEFVNGDFQIHPLHTCLLDTQNTAHLAEILKSLFLSVSIAGPNNEALDCIRLFLSVTESDARDTIFETCIGDLMYLIMSVQQNNHPVVENSLNYIKKCVNYSHRCSSLEALCVKEIMHSPVDCFKLLLLLGDTCVRELYFILPVVDREIRKVERVRDLEYDPVLRVFEQDLKNLLEKKS